MNLHDFSGHPFQAQMSRYLASQGHEVRHNYSAQYVTGHGRLTAGATDPATLEFSPIRTGIPLSKYSPVGRVRFEMDYANAWRAELEREPADVVVACNVPLFALARMRRYFEVQQIPWVLWHQDIYSMAISAEAERRLARPLARGVRTAAQRIERVQVGSAAAVIAIGEPFVRQYEQWGVATDRVSVIPNWAPLDELVPGERDNDWSARHELPTAPLRLMYAGTLGRKHNPLLLLELLDAAQRRGVDAILTVASEGVGADDLAVAAAGRPDVRLLPYQPAAEFGDMLASADVMIALLEPDAAQFSVPSKVLSYLSAGRPTIGLMPPGNPSSGDITRAGGYVAEPTSAGAGEAASWLASACAEPECRAALGRRARALAEELFDISRIGRQFDEILHGAAGWVPPAVPATHASDLLDLVDG